MVIRLAFMGMVLATGLAGVFEAPKPEFHSIFNGRNLDGWHIESGGKFLVRDGLLAVEKGTGWLRSQASYGDFVLRLEFRFLEKGANGGIFVRTAATSHDNQNGWPDNGYQVQCLDVLDGPHPLATMIPYGAPPFKSKSDLKALARAYKPGAWNVYEIRCRGEQLEVKLNGVSITKASPIKNLKGHVGIQAEHGRLEFRRLAIKQLD